MISPDDTSGQNKEHVIAAFSWLSNVDPLFMSDVYGPGLRQLSVSELTETLEEVETAIRRYSEELIQALALRDELDYEKEVLSSETSQGNVHLFILRRHFSTVFLHHLHTSV